MCGIVAAFTQNPAGVQRRIPEVEMILDRMAYRGPDAKGLWSAPHGIMGHRRLSIIDLSDAGVQPLHDWEHNLHIVFNGEIYNYQELRKELMAGGYLFHTDTDTEVILGAYSVYGMDFLQKLRGMFAFVLFDAAKMKVLLCRDRIGKKPLYYHFDGATLLVTSEIKFLHGFKGISLSIDAESVGDYFSLQYIPGPYTIYTEVRSVIPGECVELDMHTWRTNSYIYWSIQDQFRSVPVTADESTQIDALIGDCVRYRLIADVDVGILLSGGIDSSLLSCYAAAQSTKQPKAFLVSFAQQDLDESVFAKKVARSLGLDIVEMDGGNLDENLFRQIVFHADQPLGDPACVPTFMISEAISNHVKVVLSGEGADELFWGYSHYRKERVWRRYLDLLPPFAIRNGLYPLLAAIESRPDINNSFGRFSKILSAKCEMGCSSWTSIFGDAAIERLIPERRTGPNLGSRHYQRIEQIFEIIKNMTGITEASIAMDIAFWLPDDLLAKVDRMTMAHSIEARTPFLDHLLVKQALNLPSRFKADRFTGKIILRNLLKQKLPAEVAHAIANRKKHGFDVPLVTWLQHDLHNHAEACFSRSVLERTGVINARYVQSLWKSFNDCRNPSVSFARKLWLLLCFMTWHRHHTNKFGFDHQ
jgi:asparagine synthase (glutamine-hydrolysing)